MRAEFYQVVSQIPKGMVASYGYVARLAGFPRCARRVGQALHFNPDPQNIPCHRVVFKDGRLSEAFAFGGINRQRQLLQDEGVEFAGDVVNMQSCSLDLCDYKK